MADALQGLFGIDPEQQRKQLAMVNATPPTFPGLPYGAAQSPQVAPAPMGTPNLGQTSMPPVMPIGPAPTGPNLREDVLSGQVQPPSYASYQAAKPSIKDRIFAGMAAFKSPEIGEEMMREPQQRADKAYQADVGQYSTAFDQGMKQRELSGVQALQAAEIDRDTAEAAKDRLGPEKAGPTVGSTVESGGQAYQWNPDTQSYDKPIGSAKAAPEQAEVTHTFVDDKGNEVGVKRDGTTTVLGKANPEKAATEGTWSVQADDSGKPVLFNSKTGQTKPAPPGLRAPKSNEGPGAEFDRANASAASKDVETARGGDFRFRSMDGSYPNAVKGDQQAQLNLLTNHIGMTLGMQKGARITKDILNEAQKSTPWLQGVAAKFDGQGYLSGVTLTKQQMDQMMTLANQQRSNAWAQAIESARQAGVGDKVQIPPDVRIRVKSPDGKIGNIPGAQLDKAEASGYVVTPQ